MNLSPHFTREELEFSETAIRFGIDNRIPEGQLLTWIEGLHEVVEPIRKAAGVPLHINSAYRCEQLNRMIGGSLTSQHRGFYIHQGVSHPACAFDLIPLQNVGAQHAVPIVGAQGVAPALTKADLFDIAKSIINIPADQIIWEFGDGDNPAWVHVSYVIGLPPRFDVLMASIMDGKTIYREWHD